VVVSEGKSKTPEFLYFNLRCVEEGVTRWVRFGAVSVRQYPRSGRHPNYVATGKITIIWPGADRLIGRRQTRGTLEAASHPGTPTAMRAAGIPG